MLDMYSETWIDTDTRLLRLCIHGICRMCFTSPTHGAVCQHGGIYRWHMPLIIMLTMSSKMYEFHVTHASLSPTAYNYFLSPCQFVLEFSGGVLCYLFFSSSALLASWRINNMHRKASSANSGVRKMEFDLFDRGVDDEYNSVSLVVASRIIFATQGEMLCLSGHLSDRLYSKNPWPCWNRTFPNEVHHQSLEITRPHAVCFAGSDDAPSWEMLNYHTGMGSCFYPMICKKHQAVQKSQFLHITSLYCVFVMG